MSIDENLYPFSSSCTCTLAYLCHYRKTKRHLSNISPMIIQSATNSFSYFEKKTRSLHFFLHISSSSEGESSSITYLTNAYAKRNTQFFIFLNNEFYVLTFYNTLSSSVSVFLSILVKPESRSAMHAGSCTAWNMVSSLMVRCPVTRPLEVVMIPSTPSSVRLELASTSPGPSSSTWSQL